MDMMFDLSYSVSGEDEPFKMKFHEVIFVMEDVDCASKAWPWNSLRAVSIPQNSKKMVALGGEINKFPATLQIFPATA